MDGLGLCSNAVNRYVSTAVNVVRILSVNSSFVYTAIQHSLTCGCLYTIHVTISTEATKFLSIMIMITEIRIIIIKWIDIQIHYPGILYHQPLVL